MSNTKQMQRIRAKFNRFRILVIGRANAGKTTILQRLCDTTGNPMIFSPKGEKIETSVIAPSRGRGGHDIENQLIFESNPGFIFHDSRGFEAGSADELKLVQKFIKQRSKEKNVNDQLHAIWYCIPTSDDRPITTAEQKFFKECGTGLVPVIVLWTKTDALDVGKFQQLMKEGISRSEAMERAPQESWADFEKDIYQRFDEFKYKPKAYVVFRNMHVPGTDSSCNDLIEKTAAALSNEELQQLFVSTQQNNIETCVTYGVKRVVNSAEPILQSYFKKNQVDWRYFVAIVLGHFPHFIIDDLHGGGDHLHLFGDLLEHLVGDLFFEHHNQDTINNLMEFILSGLSPAFKLKEATYCAIVAAIVGHLAFFLHQKSPTERNSLERAVQIYRQSGHDTSVRQEIERIFQLENLFEGSHRNQVKRFLRLEQYLINHELLATEAVQVALDNFLPLSTQ